MVYWQHDGDGDGDFTDGSTDRRYYTILDRNFSVIGLKRDTSSEFEERVRYTPYGQAQAFPKADINNDGSASTSDLTTLLSQLGNSIGDGTYIAEADLNHDGSITTSDLTIYLGASGTTIPDGDLSAINSIVGYDGYLYEHATGLYCVRNRWYDADTGRWISRDPLEYVDGSNLYEYAASSPLQYVDPEGTRLKSIIRLVPNIIKGTKIIRKTRKIKKQTKALEKKHRKAMHALCSTIYAVYKAACGVGYRKAPCGKALDLACDARKACVEGRRKYLALKCDRYWGPEYGAKGKKVPKRVWKGREKRHREALSEAEDSLKNCRKKQKDCEKKKAAATNKPCTE